MAINGDLTLGLSLGMDTAALALTGMLGRQSLRPGRLFLGAAAGTLPTLVVLLTPSWSLGLLDVVVTPWVMVGVAFYPDTRREWITLTATLYAVSVGLGGATLALSGLGIPFGLAVLLGPVGALGLAHWWRSTVTRPLRDRSGRVRIRLWRGGRSTVLEGLWDSGNQLHTPTGMPVVVVAEDAVRPLVEPGGRVTGTDGGGRDVVKAGEAVAERVRATTVAGSLTLLILGVDKAEVEVNGEWKALRPLVIGVSDSWHGRAREVQALVNPDWLLEPVSRYA